MTNVKKFSEMFWGALSLVVLTITTVLTFIPILFICILKLIPNTKWQVFCTRLLHLIVIPWSDFNYYAIKYTNPIDIQINGEENIRPSDWYLVIANHQSWLDIVILQYALNNKKRLPILTFFIKDQLKWIPILGFTWWALGFPFMKRYSKEFLKNNPHKKGHDLKATLKAMNKLQILPATFINFIEGTRFTEEKKRHQQIEYKNLLKPKSGGVSFAVGSMHEKIKSILDVTIVYKDKKNSLWDFLCHRTKNIIVDIRSIELPDKFRQPLLMEDEALQLEFRAWLNEKWLEKDILIESIKLGDVSQ